MPSSGQNRCVVELNPPQLAGSVICGQIHLAEAFRGLSSVKPIGVSLLPLTSHGRDANSSNGPLAPIFTSVRGEVP